MPIFGGGKKPKKPSRKKRLQGAFSIQVSPTARDKAAAAKEAAKDAAIRTLAREKKKEAERAAAVEKADALKEAALEQRRGGAGKGRRRCRAGSQSRTTVGVHVPEASTGQEW